MPGFWEEPATPTTEETQWSPMIAACANTLEPAQNCSSRKPGSLSSLRAAANRKRKEEQDAQDLCRYPSKQCLQKRAMKRNGEMHSFCEFHRSKANRNQRKLERKRRAKKAVAKIEEDKQKMSAMVTQARYCANGFGDLEWNGFEWVQRDPCAPPPVSSMHPAFHNVLYPQQPQPSMFSPLAGPFPHPMDHPVAAAATTTTAAFLPFDQTNQHLLSMNAAAACAAVTSFPAASVPMVEFSTTSTGPTTASSLQEIDSLSVLPEDFSSLVSPALDAAPMAFYQ